MRLSPVKIRAGVIVMAIAASLAAASYAQETKVKTQVVSREISGEVSGISPTFIAVQYAQNEEAAYEVALKMDKNTRATGNKKLNEIGLGDIVKVTYDEVSEIEEGKKPRIVNRVARLVELRRQAERKPDEGALTSQGQQ